MAAGLEGLTIRTEFPRRVRSYDDWIELADGCRVQVRVWLPEDAEQDPVPALFEQIPYRMDDAMAITETIRHPYLAGFGYASARVDIRGSGNSDGLLLDEYLEQEQDDALEIIAWLAAQPWCTGSVGMFGLSWGGFASLQVAARRPPALGAIVAVGATHDRYLDDVHYDGGCVHRSMLGWASQMFAFDARPPDPAVVGERWREMWLERLEQAPALETWLAHQRYDGYWKHGSVKEVFDRIRCPVYIVSGWADYPGYRNPVPAVLEGLSVPCKGLIGPWGHDYPDEGSPGPTIGFLQECVRFYDRWLKGVENGIEHEPKLVFWLPDPPAGRERREEVPGRWAAEPEWPSPTIATRTLHLNRDGLAPVPGEEAALAIRGLDTPEGRWLCFDSEPLEERADVVGNPYVELALAADRPVATVVVRLCDVAPDGVAFPITGGALNLTHRDGHERPAPLEPGRRYRARVRLDLQAHAVAPGHRLRVLVSPVDWTRIWPAPEPVTLTVFAGPDCRLELPVRAPRPQDADLRAFGPPEGSEPRPHEVLYSRTTTPELFPDVLERDLATGHHEHRQGRALGWRFTDDGLVYSQRVRSSFSSVEGNPSSALHRIEHTIVLRRGWWDVRVETASTISAEHDSFWTTNTVEGYERDARVFSKTFTRRIPRDLV